MWMDVISVIAIMASPIIAVIVGQKIQDKSNKRADKMEVFKALMISRGLGWSIESVKALNTIEIVFCDDKKVLGQWKTYYDKLCVEEPSDMELSKMKTEGDKLLDVMAKSLGYKDIVTWETIQKPYIPKGLTENVSQQEQYKNAQISAMNMVNSYIEQMAQKGNEANN